MQVGTILRNSLRAYFQLMFKDLPIASVQRNELSKSYYAGAMTVLTTVMQIGDREDLSQEQSARILQSMMEECVKFAISLPDNGSEPHFTEEELSRRQ